MRWIMPVDTRHPLSTHRMHKALDKLLEINRISYAIYHFHVNSIRYRFHSLLSFEFFLLKFTRCFLPLMMNTFLHSIFNKFFPRNNMIDEHKTVIDRIRKLFFLFHFFRFSTFLHPFSFIPLSLKNVKLYPKWIFLKSKGNIVNFVLWWLAT